MKQRISTLKSRPCHADCLQARSMLTGQPYIPAFAVAVGVAQPLAVAQPALPAAAVAAGVAQPALPAAAVALNMRRVQEDEDEAQEVGGPGDQEEQEILAEQELEIAATEVDDTDD